MTQILAYFLPQFHKEPINESFWGEGFTDWNHIRGCKEYFSWQKIRKPVSSYYDLSEPSTMAAQFESAKECGIDGFIVWNYWFGNNEKALNTPIENILEKNIDFKFCFAWANHSWINKKENILIKQQKYLGINDYKEYFNYCLKFFKTDNYIKIDNKPVFFVFNQKDIPSAADFMTTFTEEAIKNGFSGIYFVAENSKSKPEGFNAFLNSAELISSTKFVHPFESIKYRIKRYFLINSSNPYVFDYEKLINSKIKREIASDEIPSVLSGWDTTPRHAGNGVIFKNFNEENFRKELQWAFKQNAKKKIDSFIVIKSWNEWGEGNILEKDNIFSDRIQEVVHEIKYKNRSFGVSNGSD